MCPLRVRGWWARLSRKEQSGLFWGSKPHAPNVSIASAPTQLGKASQSATIITELVLLSLLLKWKILVTLGLVPLTSLPSGK